MGQRRDQERDSKRRQRQNEQRDTDDTDTFGETYGLSSGFIEFGSGTVHGVQ